MSYQALYRLWRPDRFDRVVGQQAVVETLRNQVRSGHIAHAYLFCGTHGTGKTTTARLMARAINCEHPVDGESCGQCQPCQLLQQENNMDIIEIDGASNSRVDEVRELIEKVKYPPQFGRYKVYIIDEVHALSAGAFSALLKTLEEPPAHAVFILATTDPQRLPTTILSRCQRFDFRRITASDVAGHLARIAQSVGVAATEGALFQIARASEGAMRDAISMLDLCISYGQDHIDEAVVQSALGLTGSALRFAFVDALAAGDAGEALRVIDRLLEGGGDSAVFCRELVGHLRGVLVSAAVEDCASLLDVSPEDAARLAQQAQALGVERALRAMELFTAAQAEMRWAAQPSTVLEMTAFRACRPQIDRSLEALTARVEALEKKLEQGFVPAQAAPAPAAPKAAAPRRAAPAKAPAPAATASDGELWQKLLARVKKEKLPLYSTVRGASFLGLREDNALVCFEPEMGIFHDMLAQEANKGLVERIFSELTGRPIRLQLSISQPPPAQLPSQEDTLRAASGLFGRENIEVVDE